MALTTQGSIEPPRDPRSTNAAAAAYGEPANATRMDRMAETADIAAQYTTGDGTEASYADGSLTLGEATLTPHKASRK